MSHTNLTHLEIAANEGGTAGVPLVPIEYVGREDFFIEPGERQPI